MQIIREIKSKRVVYMLAEEDFLALRNDRLITDKFTAYDIGVTTHDLVLGVQAPDVFVGSALIYDNGWFVVDQQAIDAETERLRIVSAAQVREASKAARDVAVANINVTVSTGKVFDGDETSQTRMARAIVGMQAAGVNAIFWKLLDNSVAEVTLAEITEALILAGQEQARLWVL